MSSNSISNWATPDVYKNFGVKLPASAKTLDQVPKTTMGTASSQLLGAIAMGSKNVSPSDASFVKNNITNGALNPKTTLPYNIIKDDYTALFGKLAKELQTSAGQTTPSTNSTTVGTTASQLGNVSDLLNTMNPKNASTPLIPSVSVSQPTGQIVSTPAPN